MAIDPIIETRVSPLIPAQFPDFYREHGPLFVEFLRLYYRWMESQGQVLYHARRLPSYRDVDTVPEDLIVYLKQKYLTGIQLETESNVRELIKHSLDLYRSKGTERSIDLLFRLVFGTGADVYYPKEDVFRLSAGEWSSPTYLEVAPGRVPLTEFLGYQVQGATSRARAFVERVVRKKLPSKYVDVIYVSSVAGTFQAGEIINRTASPLAAEDCPMLLGSLSGVKITDGGSDYSVGDIVDVLSPHGRGGKGRVAEVGTESGTVTVELVDGGFGYTNSSQLIVSDKILSLTSVPGGAGEYARLFDRVEQKMADVGYESATGTFSVGEQVFAYDGSDEVRGVAVVMSASELDPGEGVMRLSIVSGDLEGGPFYTTGNAVSAVQKPLEYELDVATGNVVAMTSTTLFFPFPAAFVVGEEIYQQDLGSGIVTSVTDQGLRVTARDVSGRFFPGVSVVGRSSGSVMDLSSVSIDLGVIVEDGVFVPGATSYCFLPDGQSSPLGSVSVGEGFTAEIGSIGSVETVELGVDLLEPYLDVSLLGPYGFPADPDADIDSNIAESLPFQEVEVGEIDLIMVTNPGSGYNLPPAIRVLEPRTYSLDKRWWRVSVTSPTFPYLLGETVVQDETGARGEVIEVSSTEYLIKRMSLFSNIETGSVLRGADSGASAVVASVEPVAPSPMQWRRTGIDAEIITKSVTASGVVRSMEVIDSGLGYDDVEIGSFRPEDPRSDATPGSAILAAETEGRGRGRYKKRGGFLSDSKKLFDGHYYQDYSYEVGSSVPVDRYRDMLRDTLHLAGTRMYGALDSGTMIDAAITGSMVLVVEEIEE